MQNALKDVTCHQGRLPMREGNIKFKKTGQWLCGSVGKAVASDTRGPRIESSHRQKILTPTVSVQCYNHQKHSNQCDHKKLPNVYKSHLKLISQDLTPLQKLPKNVGKLCKLIAATGFEKLPKI